MSARPGRHALVATATLHGVQVDEVRVPAGKVLEVGPKGRMRLPTPDGAPYLALAEWTGPDTLLVTDAAGDRHRIGPDDHLDLALGPVRLDLRVVRAFTFKRTQPFPWFGSLAWLVTVMAFSLVVAQVDVVLRNRCLWFGLDCPVEQGGLGAWNAEYLARLLREDLDGEDQGVIEQKTPTAPTVITVDVYLPAGDPDGPKHQELGGAAETAPVPERRPEAEALPPAPRPKDEPPPLAAAEGQGVPIVVETPPEAPAEDPEGVVEADEGVEAEAPEEAPTDPSPGLAEEREGWGLSDWLDAAPEDREVELMLRVARHRLRIDPDNPDALSLLAYYQYLADDMEGAEATYDRLIELFPEDSAAYNNKALVYKRRGAYAKEEGLYRVALALRPDDTTAMNNLAVNLAHQGRFDEALAMMDRLDVLLPDDPYSHLHRSKIHAEMGQDEEALAWLDKALAGMSRLDTLHHIEFRQDIRVDPSFARLRDDHRFRAILQRYYGSDSPLR